MVQKSKMNKIRKHVRLCTLSVDWFSRPLTDIVTDLLELQDKYKDCSDVRIEVDYGQSELEGYDVYGTRLETDEEYQKRIKVNKQVKDRKAKEQKENLEYELQEYLRLKSKFDKTNFQDCDSK